MRPHLFSVRSTNPIGCTRNNYETNQNVTGKTKKKEDIKEKD